MVEQDNRNQGGNQLDNQGEIKADGPDNRPVSSMAIVSLVLGIVALLASFFKEIGLVASGSSAPCWASSSHAAEAGTRERSWSSSAW